MKPRAEKSSAQLSAGLFYRNKLVLSELGCSATDRASVAFVNASSHRLLQFHPR